MVYIVVFTVHLDYCCFVVGLLVCSCLIGFFNLNVCGDFFVVRLASTEDWLD